MEDTLATLFAAVAGAILSLFFEFFPGVSKWFQALTKEQKQLVTGGSMLVVAVAIFGMSCLNWLSQFFPDIALTCDVAGGWIVFQAWIAAVGSSQLFHISGNKLIHFIAKSIKK